MGGIFRLIALVALAAAAAPLALAQAEETRPSDGFLTTREDFLEELELRCPRGEEVDSKYRPCANIAYAPVEPGPGSRGPVLRPIFSVDKQGEFAWAIWQGRVTRLRVRDLYGNVTFPDSREAEAKAGATHAYFPTGIIGRKENEACKCLVFPNAEQDPFRAVPEARQAMGRGFMLATRLGRNPQSPP